MRVFALWHGGASYSPSSIHDGDLEVHPSLSAAMEAFRERYDSNGQRTCDVPYVDRAPESTLFPAVDQQSTTMDVYRYDPRETSDPYPDLRLSFGPRGGVRSERY